MNSPTVRRNTLRILAGTIWSAVGIGLCIAAGYWILTSQGNWIAAVAIGLVFGILAYSFGFRRLVRRNVARIDELAPEKQQLCLFAFQSWRSYAIMMVMIAMGYTARHLPISRLYLVPVYLAMGIALLLASLHYYTSAK